MINFLMHRWNKYNFLFEELVKRDFKKRYKRAVLGVFWSMLGPLLHLTVMSLIFIDLLGRGIPHFQVYVFSGLKVYAFFKESTSQGMHSLTGNSSIFTKVKIPKYLFLLSKNVSSLLNFGILLIVFFIFAAFDGVTFHPRFIFLLYPMLTLMLFNIGVGLILSALFVFFKDIQYIYEILTLMIMWLSAIFYSIDGFSITVQRMFLLNPIFTHIHYFRLIVLHGTIPAWHIHLLCAVYAAAALLLGSFFYKRFNTRFVYHL